MTQIGFSGFRYCSHVLRHMYSWDGQFPSQVEVPGLSTLPWCSVTHFGWWGSGTTLSGGSVFSMSILFGSYRIILEYYGILWNNMEYWNDTHPYSNTSTSNYMLPRIDRQDYHPAAAPSLFSALWDAGGFLPNPWLGCKSWRVWEVSIKRYQRYVIQSFNLQAVAGFVWELRSPPKSHL